MEQVGNSTVNCLNVIGAQIHSKFCKPIGCLVLGNTSDCLHLRGALDTRRNYWKKKEEKRELNKIICCLYVVVQPPGIHVVIVLA